MDKSSIYHANFCACANFHTTNVYTTTKKRWFSWFLKQQRERKNFTWMFCCKSFIFSCIIKVFLLFMRSYSFKFLFHVIKIAKLRDEVEISISDFNVNIKRNCKLTSSHDTVKNLSQLKLIYYSANMKKRTFGAWKSSYVENISSWLLGIGRRREPNLKGKFRENIVSSILSIKCFLIHKSSKQNKIIHKALSPLAR